VASQIVRADVGFGFVDRRRMLDAIGRAPHEKLAEQVAGHAQGGTAEKFCVERRGHLPADFACGLQYASVSRA